MDVDVDAATITTWAAQNMTIGIIAFVCTITLYVLVRGAWSACAYVCVYVCVSDVCVCVCYIDFAMKFMKLIHTVDDAK